MTADELVALCDAALPAERLTADEIVTCCFGSGMEVVGDNSGAVVLSVSGGAAWIVLLAVQPQARGRGRGRELVDAALERAQARGAREVHLGNAVPRYVWPGVDFAFTEALALFEACGFEPYGAECNMALDTGFRSSPAAGTAIERETGPGATALARVEFPHWVDEVTRAVTAGTCFAARDDTGATIGFGCHSVNRHGWIGPMATTSTRRNARVGHAVLGALCADLAARGTVTAEVAWVGPIGFYARAGARVSRVFRTARRRL